MENQDYGEGGTDLAVRVKNWMQRAGISSFRQLSRQAGVSRWQVQQLLQGKLWQMRLEILDKISQALQVPLNELIGELGGTDKGTEANTVSVQEEYQRLQQEIAQQRETLRAEFQQAGLDLLESWLKQWPKAVKAARENPQLPAANVVALVSPVERLVASWGVETIAAIGEEIPYDPRWHQLTTGNAIPGEIVTVKAPGYRQGEKLLYRAEVSGKIN
ncbi:MAG TPA: helix-turn-helix domain-containing protein [Oscillatoriaceae cyanobacterium M33_DOE_052]|uniref:HTH cro/C1-type domain-containing protein n=1 Tax=Planktothricoides sp. SpSt-374 TaxID=2282167 RepID=A0A7C3VQN3_9CYAN|nr:helix-turn-helix domain-containing protein [Oscillatoriaceae cyanobacterium M33_DOE_052]